MVKITRDLKSNYTFPVSDKSIKKAIELALKEKDRDLEILITVPKTNEDINSYARYDPDNKRIILFAHYTLEDGTMLVGPLEMSKKEFRKTILEEIIFHEAGHHIGIKYYNDKSEDFAENYLNKIKRKLNYEARRKAKKDNRRSRKI